jgi:hypothetical protein
MPDLKGQASGKFDLKFNVKNNANGTYGGSGSLTSSALTLRGMKLSNIMLPISLSNTAFKSDGGSLALYGGKAANTFSLDLGTMKFNDTLNVTGADVNALAQDASGGLNGKITGRGNLSMKLSGALSPKLTYSGSGEFTMGEGAISGFSGLDLLTKLHGVNGIRYTKVTAPLRMDMAKLTIAKGASAVPPADDPLYRSAVLAEDGSVTLDAAKKLHFLADLSVNFQLINALTGGVAGGADTLIKGGTDIGGNLEDILKGAVNTGIERGKNADFRNATVKVTGTSEKPAYAVVKIGSSAAQPSVPQSPAPSAETPAAEKPSLEEKVREEINKQFQKGLGDLFK